MDLERPLIQQPGDEPAVRAGEEGFCQSQAVGRADPREIRQLVGFRPDGRVTGVVDGSHAGRRVQDHGHVREPFPVEHEPELRQEHEGGEQENRRPEEERNEEPAEAAGSPPLGPVNAGRD